MENSSFQMIDGKVIIRIKDRLCDNADELLSSELFLRVFNRCISDLEHRNSRLLGIFENKNITERDIQLLLEALHFLTRLPGD